MLDLLRGEAVLDGDSPEHEDVVEPDDDEEREENNENIKAIGIDPCEGEWGKPLKMGCGDSDDAPSEDDENAGNSITVATRGVVRVEDGVIEQATALSHHLGRSTASGR